MDLALITEVLPAAGNRAKDLGLINAANTFPQLVSALFAGFLIRYAGGYPTMFATAGGIMLASGLLVRRIRGVR